MNAPTIVRTTRTEWLRRGIAITGALVISGSVALGLANRATINVAPAAAARHVSSAQERFMAVKDRQAEARDTTFALAPIQPPAADGSQRSNRRRPRRAIR